MLPFTAKGDKMLDWLVVQDRHGQSAYSYAGTRKEASELAKEWDETHGKCGDHFHKSKVWSIKNWVKTFGKTPEEMFD